MDNPVPYIAQCPCGKCQVELTQIPSVRFLCHCTICQSVYPGDFADATLLRADKVSIKTPEEMTFSQLKAPPALDRGICNSCKHPVIGFLDGPLGVRFAFLPTVVLPKNDYLPKPLRHVYYDSRINDIDDALPKSGSPMMSQLALTLPIIRVTFGW